MLACHKSHILVTFQGLKSKIDSSLCSIEQGSLSILDVFM